MNILEHILAGHYDRDSKGRALVPMSGGKIATICATDAPGPLPIFGWFEGGTDGPAIAVKWRPDGTDPGFDWLTLLPPVPRKRKIVRYLVVRELTESGPFANRADAENVALFPRGIVVEMSGA